MLRLFVVIWVLMIEKTKCTTVPFVKMSPAELENPGANLEGTAATLYRAVTARANYLSQDWSDVRYAVKELSRSMSQPTEGDMVRLKRLGKYLRAHPRLVQNMSKQPQIQYIDVWVDIDFTGC